MNLLNIGCGDTYHTDWTNLDLASTSSTVQVCDLRRGIPYEDQFFDACYSSHLLEHFAQDEAKRLIAECFRILKPKGTIRIVVPDLEAIIKVYICSLEQIDDGIVGAIENYDWIMLELYDQVIRNESGGDMIRYLQRADLSNRAFIESRIGSEAKKHWNLLPGSQAQPKLYSPWNRLKIGLSTHPIRRMRLKLAKLLVTLLAGIQACQAFEAGLFRNTGEIHRWMYDRVSLRRLLEQAGFVETGVCRAEQSRIINFHSYSLDVIEGEVRKPDSLFMEATKP